LASASALLRFKAGHHQHRAEDLFPAEGEAGSTSTKMVGPTAAGHGFFRPSSSSVLWLRRRE
jgi:hypothetical protein